MKAPQQLSDPRQIDLEDAIAALKEERRRAILTASPKAVRLRDRLAKKGELGRGIPLDLRAAKFRKPRPPTQRQVRDATRPEETEAENRAAFGLERAVSKVLGHVPQIAQYIRSRKAALEAQANPLWSAPKDTSSPGHPTAARQAKEPYDWKKEEKSGGQVQHQARIYQEVYRKHLSEPQLQAIKLIEAAYETLEEAEKITGSRIYSGGASSIISLPEKYANLSERKLEQVLDNIALAREWFAEVSAGSGAWRDRVEAAILRRPIDASGRIAHVAEIGARLTAYPARTKGGSWSDSATAAGVVGINDALIVYLEALQRVLTRRQFKRMAAKGRMTAETARLGKHGMPQTPD